MGMQDLIWQGARLKITELAPSELVVLYAQRALALADASPVAAATSASLPAPQPNSMSRRLGPIATGYPFAVAPVVTSANAKGAFASAQSSARAAASLVGE